MRYITSKMLEEDSAGLVVEHVDAGQSILSSVTLLTHNIAGQ